MKWTKEDIIFIIVISIISSLFYLRGYWDAKEDIYYYKEKSRKEQQLLWRIKCTFPQQWENIKNTPEYHQCIQYDIEKL